MHDADRVGVLGASSGFGERSYQSVSSRSVEVTDLNLDNEASKFDIFTRSTVEYLAENFVTLLDSMSRADGSSPAPD